MAEHFNKLTPKQQEMLVKLGEEGSEVAQQVSKILLHGLLDVSPVNPEKGTQLEKLHSELGDFMAICFRLEQMGIIYWSKVRYYEEQKLLVLDKYLHHSRD